MKPIRAFFKWLDSHFTARPWPERRAAVVPSRETCESGVRFYAAMDDNASRRFALATERLVLQAKLAKAKRDKKRRSHIERALRENTNSLLALERGQ